MSLVTLNIESDENATISEHLELVKTGLDCIQMVFDTPTNPKNDFCRSESSSLFCNKLEHLLRLFCKAGLLKPLMETLYKIATCSPPIANHPEVIERILNGTAFFWDLMNVV